MYRGKGKGVSTSLGGFGPALASLFPSCHFDKEHKSAKELCSIEIVYFHLNVDSTCQKNVNIFQNPDRNPDSLTNRTSCLLDLL